MQPSQQPIQTPCEVQAKEKLSQYVYEFLQLSGATKTAEAYKEEVLNNLPNTSSFKVAENGTGFLHNWWLVFWDVYCAAPERRDDPQAPPTQEGKYFYENFVTPNAFGPQPPMMNGMPGMFPGGPMAMGPDGMMGPGFPPGRFQGRGGPPGGMGGPYMFAGGGDPRMVAQRMQQNAMRMPNAPFAPVPGMRPNPGGPPPGVQFGRPPGFMDSPGQAFPPGMVPNGISQAGQMPLSSPGMVPDSSQHSFMMGNAMPTSSAIPFGMGDTTISMGNGSTPATSMGDMSNMAQMNMMMNGEEMKQSPASTPRGVNGGGTPAPGSAQSVQQSGTPVGDLEKPASIVKEETNGHPDEISKIRQGLLDDFNPKDDPVENSGGQFFA